VYAYRLIAEWEANLHAAHNAHVSEIFTELKKHGTQIPESCADLFQGAGPRGMQRVSIQLPPTLEGDEFMRSGSSLPRARMTPIAGIAASLLQHEQRLSILGPEGSLNDVLGPQGSRSKDGGSPVRLTNTMMTGLRSVSQPQQLAFMLGSEEENPFNVRFRAPLFEILSDHLRGRSPWHKKKGKSAETLKEAGLLRDTESSVDPAATKWVLQPDSAWRFRFEVVCFLALMHDSIAIPFTIAWELAPLGLLISSSLSLLVWTMDLMLNFTTGYFKWDGEVEMGRRQIVKNYMRSWFLVDFCTVTCDWLTLVFVFIASASEDNLTLARAFRVARVARGTRIVILIRLLRNSRRALKMGKFSFTGTGQILLQVMKILLFILWVNHVFSCIWYLTGRAALSGVLHADTNQSWLDLPVGDTTFENVGVAFQYTSCMHWSMTQMTPGSMEIVPQNSYERAFNIFCLVFGLLFGTTLVGQISSKMVQFNMSRQVELRRTDELRRFLRENNVAAALALRIQRQSADRMQDKSRLSEQDVEDIKHLSAHLRLLLRQEIFIPHLVRHPLFSSWGARDPSAVKDLCSSGLVCFECLAPGHDLFTSKHSMDRAYLFLRGRAVYSCHKVEDDEEEEEAQAREQSVKGKRAFSSIRAGQPSHKTSSSASKLTSLGAMTLEAPQGAWICESALWMEWVALGNLEALRQCEFVSIMSTAVIDMLKHHPKIADITIGWCQALHELFASTKVLQDHDWEMYSDHSDIILGCAEEWRLYISQQAFSMLEIRYGSGVFGKAKGLKELGEELSKGTSALACEGGGEIVRIVPVVALLLTRSHDYKFLVQIATKQANQGWKPSCVLPGKKLKIGDSPMEAAQLLLESELCTLVSSDTALEFCARDKDMKDSMSYGVKSVYHRSVWHGEVEPLCVSHMPSKHEHTNSTPSDRGAAKGPVVRTPPVIPQRATKQHTNTKAALSLWDLEFEVVEGAGGKNLMYAWVSDHEFMLLKKGTIDEEIARIDHPIPMLGPWKTLSLSHHPPQHSARSSRTSDKSRPSRDREQQAAEPAPPQLARFPSAATASSGASRMLVGELSYATPPRLPEFNMELISNASGGNGAVLEEPPVTWLAETGRISRC